MKLDIPYYIRQVLREKRMVTVPGIGTFKLEQTSASFNADKSTISPPSLNIIFNETESNDQSLVQYILDLGAVSEEKVRKKIDQFTQSVFNSLLNVDSFLIEGIGVITRNSGNDKVDFKPNLESLTKEFSGLKPLGLTPIVRSNEKKNITTLYSSDTKPQETGSFLPRIIFFSLLLIALYFLGRYLFDKYYNDPAKTEIGFTDDGENEMDEMTYDNSNEKELEQKYEEIDELIEPLKNKEKSEETDEAEPEVLNDRLNMEENEADKPSNTEGMGGYNADSNENSEFKTIGNLNQEGEFLKGAKGDPGTQTLNKHANIIPETGECIIIVGSFIKSLNTIKMVSLLERKGYKVYQGEYKGYNRVGIKYECIDTDLEAYLQDIRKQISKKAWYLDPELEVPYIM